MAFKSRNSNNNTDNNIQPKQRLHQVSSTSKISVENISDNKPKSLIKDNLEEKSDKKIVHKTFLEQSITVLNILEQKHGIYIYNENRYPGMYLNPGKQNSESAINFLKNNKKIVISNESNESKKPNPMIDFLKNSSSK